MVVNYKKKIIDDQLKLRGTGVAVTVVCEYPRALSSTDAKSDHIKRGKNNVQVEK